MKFSSFKRTAALVGAGSAVAAALFGAGQAMAAVGDPAAAGQLVLTPDATTTPQPTTTIGAWKSNTACPAGFQAGAILSIYDLTGTRVSDFSAKINGGVNVPGFGGPWNDSLAPYIGVVFNAGTTYEFVSDCFDATGATRSHGADYYLTISADGATYTTSATNSGPVKDTVTVTSPTAGASITGGTATTLTATESPVEAGTFQFKSNGANIGSAVSSSTGTGTTTFTLTCGANAITALFTPTNTASPASESAPVNVSVNGGTCAQGGAATVDVVVGATGQFIFTTPAAVHLGQAVASGGNLGASAPLTGGKVDDTRNDSPSKGWKVTGAISQTFVSGANSFSGNQLGWAPAVTGTTGATAGPAITAGSNPGLVQGGTWASAATGTGTGTTTLGGTVNLSIPSTTPQGTYSATLTLTALDIFA